MEDYKKHFKDKVVLITGGAGSIGSRLTQTIAQLNARTVIAKCVVCKRKYNR
jgi:FlaA1/EpsC-like NDP-sugar epimerase